ncbi:MAG: hypothetical protein JWN30_1507, partial [Bacilli bacterium]|nr:hypothetical protein [Bacilli bacterium]
MEKQKRMERLLFEAQKRMDDILLSIDLFVWSFDLIARKISFFSGGLEDFCGMTPAHLKEDIQNAIDVIHSDDLPVFRKAWNQIKAGGT